MNRSFILLLLAIFTLTWIATTAFFCIESTRDNRIKLHSKQKSEKTFGKKEISKPNNKKKFNGTRFDWSSRSLKPIDDILPQNIERKTSECVNQKLYPCDNGISFNEDDTMYRNEIDHGKWKQIFVDLPPFHWETPHLLTNESSKWFWMQPENMRHFEDTINRYSGCVRVIKNGIYKAGFVGGNNVTHYTNIRGDPEFTDKPEYDIAFFLTSHQTEYFQHFLDNGIPHIAMMLLATGYNPKDVTMVISGWNTQAIPDILTRWGFKVVKKGSVSAKILVLPEIIPVIHQKFYEVFLDGMKFNYSNPDKIVLISRKNGDTHKNERLINNQDELFSKMKEVYGDKAVLFVPKENNFSSSIDLFEKAKLVIGSHGGAMYNSMFSSHDTKIIEIIPVENSGLYTRQNNPNSIPPFAHLAMYTNAQLMGQPFYRHYQITRGTTNMNVDIDVFIKFINDVLNDRV